EALHAAIAHDEELAIDRGRKPECLDEIWKASGNVLTGARIEMGDEATVFVATGDGLNSNAVPFPLTHEIPWIERREITVFDGMRQHRRAKRCWIARDRLVGAAFKPGEQVEVRRLQAGPQELDLLRILISERGRGGLGKTRRNADPQTAGH